MLHIERFQVNMLQENCYVAPTQVNSEEFIRAIRTRLEAKLA